MCRPQTRHKQYYDEGLDLSILPALLVRNLHSFVQTLQIEIDIKCIMWGVTNSRMLDGKADGCSQWFLSRLA